MYLGSKKSTYPAASLNVPEMHNEELASKPSPQETIIVDAECPDGCKRMDGSVESLERNLRITPARILSREQWPSDVGVAQSRT